MHRHTTGLTRREVLQVGYSGLLGVSLAGLLSKPARAVAAPDGGGKAQSVVLVFLTGGPSHLDMFDPKPDAPAEVRGEFKPMDTNVPGIRFSEHLPRLAARADRLAVVRSLSHPETNHLLATHRVLTGTAIPGGKFDQVASRGDWPDYAGGLDALRPRNDGVPTGVNLPTFLVEGPLTWPGQHAGFLGAKHDPWQVRQDPNRPDFHVDGFGLVAGLGVERLELRRELLGQLEHAAESQTSDGRPFAEMQDRAFTLLTSGRVAQAFDLRREPDRVRDRYGRHMFGQSLLLARRLVQAGVPMVQANMGHVQTWDSHGAIFPRLKNELLPPLDQAVAALLDDLMALGLLDRTLVMVLGEFGRTPKLSAPPGDRSAGRDHWPSAFCGVFAGAGVRGGQVVGKTDKIGAFPTTPPYTPDDVGATVYHALGVDHEADVPDPFGRPVRLNRGAPIEALYTA